MHSKIQAFLRKALSVISLVSIFLFSVGSLAPAQAQGEVSLFTDIDAPDKMAASQAAVRSRTVGINLGVLSGPQGDLGSQALKGNTIQMNLFEDTAYNVVIDSIEASASGGTAWNGHIAGQFPSYAYMIYTEGVFAAHVASLRGVYEVQYSGGDIYTISQLEHSLYPDDLVLEPALPENAPPAVEPDTTTKVLTDIDVMVLYTERAVTAVGGSSAMNARVDLAVQETNQSYVNSNVNQRINLVYAGQVTYDEGANPDFGTTLDRLTGKVDGFMDNVHSLRNVHSADLVSLVIEGTQYCGIAWLMSSPSVSFESDGFSVVAQSCATGYYSFAHELGHNMGSRHDTYVDPQNTPYPYSHGFTYPAANWRTIMAYNNACTAVGANCTRLQYWSNPSVTHGGVAMGNAGTADNHLSLNNTAATVAAFRVNNGFNKSSPSNGATNQLTNTLSLSWDASPGATHYEVCHDTVNDNACNGAWQNEGNVTGTTITGLSNNTTYYWQVRAAHGSGYQDADSGTWWSFTTITASLPGAFSKLEPANAATNQSLTPTLLWDQSTGATGYAYCYDTSNNNSCDSSWISTGTATADTLSGLTAGTTYYWQARATNSSGNTEANDNVWWSFITVAPSTNDDFLGATAIGSLPYNNPGTQNTVSATSDTSDPEFPCAGGGKKSNTVWFKFTPASATTFYVDTGGSDYNTVLAVWTGTEGALTNIGCNDDYNGMQSRIIVNGSGGTTYYIEAASLNLDAAGWLDLRVSTAVPTPSNDDFAAAPILTLPYLDWMNVDGATTDVTDPVLPCGPGTRAYQSVWFQYTPDASGEVVLSTYSSGYNTVLAVWSGTEGSLTNIGCNDDFRGSTSLLTLHLNGGSTYYVEVAKFDTSAPTDYGLYLNLVRVGDDFDVAFLLNSSLPSTATVNALQYSTFPDDPDFTACGVIGTNSVWYKFIPSQSGTLNVNTVGSDYDTILGVWSGDRGFLTSLGCDNDSAGNYLSDLSVPVTAGNTYYIEAAAWWGGLDVDLMQDGKSPPSENRSSKRDRTDASEQSGGTLRLNLSLAGVKTYLGGILGGNYYLPPGSSTRQSYAGVNSGLVKIIDTNGAPILAAERVIYKINGVNTSFTEMMGLPNRQLDTTYWLPWYNNVDLDTQLRFANVSSSLATVQVYIGGTEMAGSPFTLAAGASARKSFAGVNNGPVKIISNVDIVAAERVIYTMNGVRTSFTEMMALPNSQRDTTYWLPWYNNVDLDTQLRIANVSTSRATVHVYIGGTEMVGSPFTLDPGASTRKSFAGINNGPVKIESDHGVPIAAAERVIYTVNGVKTSFTETMGLPDRQLDSTYWLPWYNNVDLDTQLRIANTSTSPATVHVYIGGTEMIGSPFDLAAGESVRKSFAGINNGPVEIVSNHGVPIVAAERLIYKVNGTNTSFSEMMGLPAIQLDTVYWLPWYNNVDLDTQLRFGVP